MKTQRQMRVTAVAGALCAGALCAALAGCGSVTARSAGATAGAGAAGARASGARASGAGTAGAGSAAAGASAAASGGGATGSSGAGAAVGCAGVNQATSVTIRRSMHLVEPARATGLTTTRRDPALVRALLRDFCSAVGHADKPNGMVRCPASFGMSYTGTFYAGSRALATFVYGASGCQSVTVTADGKQQSTLLFGTAAAAAPRLQADMAAVLGVPKYAVSAPTIDPGGPDK